MKTMNKSPLQSKPLTPQEKRTIDKGVKKIVKDYRKTLEALAKT